MENNDNSINELGTIRQQMEILKEKLDSQEIVNERIIQASMRQRMSWIKRLVIFEMILVPVIAVCWYLLRMFLGFSWYSYIFLVVMLTIDVWLDYRINLQSMSDADYQRNNLVGIVRKLLKMKRQRALQMVIQIPLVVAWLLWTGTECYMLMPETAGIFRSGIIGGLIGGAIGTVLGVIFAVGIYRKMQRTNDEVISYINSLPE